MPSVSPQTYAKNGPRIYHPTHPLLTNSDYTKSIYLNLLDSFPDEDVIGFWDGLPMTWEGRKLSTHALLSHIWEEKTKVVMGWDYSVGESLEAFLVERNVSIIELYRKLPYRNNQSTYLPGRLLLKWFYPVMKIVFNADPRDMAMRLIPYFTENLYPGHIHRRVKKVVKGEWTESVMVYISDDRFIETVQFDSEVHTCEQVKASPGVMGLPPYEEVGILSDTRPLDLVVWKGLVTETDEIATIDGRPVGHRMDFEEFCRIHDVDLTEYKVPAKRCILMDEDYSCPIRKRIVLHAGCAYDAPVNLQTIRHLKLDFYSRDFLNHMVVDLDEDQSPLALQLRQRHEALLAKIEETADFRYHAEDESITLNGEHLVKGVPAKILRSLITTYLRDGRCDFGYREFKRDFEISAGQKNSNFEVHFYRLEEKLKEKCPSIAIAKVGWGWFELRTACKITLDDEPHGS